MINYDQEIYNGAIKGGATNELAKLITAQARHETGNYSNNQTLSNNNVFGFKYSTNSSYANKGNISPEGNAYAKYSSIQNAILDYVDRWMGKDSIDGGTRLEEFNAVTDAETFARKLKRYGYYNTPIGKTDEQVIKNYINGIKTALLRIKVIEFFRTNYAVIGLVIIGITVYIYQLKKKKIF
jgi:hypothetical protein